MGLASTLVGIYNGLTWDLLLVSSLILLQCRNYKCDFFLEFRTNMYMMGENAGKSSGNEDVKSMYMMVKHVHNMYMS